MHSGWAISQNNFFKEFRYWWRSGDLHWMWWRVCWKRVSAFSWLSYIISFALTTEMFSIKFSNKELLNTNFKHCMNVRYKIVLLILDRNWSNRQYIIIFSNCLQQGKRQFFLKLTVHCTQNNVQITFHITLVDVCTTTPAGSSRIQYCTAGCYQ